MEKNILKKCNTPKFGCIAKTFSGHFDLTKEITEMCMNRYLSRIKAQIKYLEKSETQYLYQIKGCKKDFLTLKKALKVILSCTG